MLLHRNRQILFLSRKSVGSVRYLETASAIVSELKAKIGSLAVEKKALLNELKANKALGAAPVGVLSADMVLGGMRGIKAMITDTSDLDALEGIRYRGISLQQVNEQLPKARGGTCGLPEGALWLLLTGEVPTEDQVKQLNKELHKRAFLPGAVTNTLDKLPHTMHPMTQLSAAVLMMQPESKFAKAYQVSGDTPLGRGDSGVGCQRFV